MPKLIDNLQENIISTANDIIYAEGIDSLSIRKISGRLNIAAATVYNYYENKDDIVAQVMHLHWAEALRQIDSCGKSGDTIKILSSMSEVLRNFIKPVFPLWLGSSTSYTETEKLRMHKKIIFEQVTAKVMEVLNKRNLHEESQWEEPEEMAKSVTKLLFACAHYDDFDFKTIAKAIKQI